MRVEGQVLVIDQVAMFVNGAGVAGMPVLVVGLARVATIPAEGLRFAVQRQVATGAGATAADSNAWWKHEPSQGKALVYPVIKAFGPVVGGVAGAALPPALADAVPLIAGFPELIDAGGRGEPFADLPEQAQFMRKALHLFHHGVVDVRDVAIGEAVVPIEPVGEALVGAQVLEGEGVADVPIDHEGALLVVELFPVVAGRQPHDVRRVGAADVILGHARAHVVLRRHERPAHAQVIHAGPVVGTVERVAGDWMLPGHGAARVIRQVAVLIDPSLIHRPEARGVVVGVARDAITRVALGIGGDRVLAHARPLAGDAVAAVAEVALAVGAPVVEAEVRRHIVANVPLQDEREVLVVQVFNVFAAGQALDGGAAQPLHAGEAIGHVVRERAADEAEPLVGVILAEDGAHVGLEALVVRLVGDVVHHAADGVAPI